MQHAYLLSCTAAVRQELQNQQLVLRELLVASTLALQMPLQFLWLMEAAPTAVAAYRDCCAGIPIYYRKLLLGVGKEQSQSVTAFCISAPCHPAATSA